MTILLDPDVEPGTDTFAFNVTLFTMKVINELSYQGIAKSYGKTESWARVTYYRAKAKIVSMMERKT